MLRKLLKNKSFIEILAAVIILLIIVVITCCAVSGVQSIYERAKYDIDVCMANYHDYNYCCKHIMEVDCAYRD